MKQTLALRKISSLKKKIRVIQGGQGAGKTIAILILLCNHASSSPSKEIIIASAELTKMRLTVIKDFVKVMKSFGIYNDNHFIAGTLYRFPNGSFIKFIGLDKDDVGKGLRGDVFYLNEGDKVGFEAYREVASRFKNIYIDFNPNNAFWAHDHVIVRDDCDFIKLTFLDNEYLSDEEKAEILLYHIKGYGVPYDSSKPSPEPISKYWANKWRVYGLGEVGILEGAVFEDWEQVDELPPEAKLVGCGVDFGFANPSAWIACYKLDDHYYFDQLIYEDKLTNQDMAEMIIAMQMDRELTYADSAEPKSIAEIREFGIPIHPCDDKRDLVNYAVKILNQKTFYVTKRSKETVAELLSYVWDKDNQGRHTGKPKKHNDHAMNALCYFIGTENKYAGNYR